MLLIYNCIYIIVSAWRISWATTVRLELLVAHIFVPRIRARCRVALVCILVFVYVYGYRLSRNYTFPFFACLDIYPCACLCFWPGNIGTPALNLKFAHFLREVCAKFAQSWADKLSHWQDCCLLLIYALACLQADMGTGFAWDCQCNKQKSDAELSRKHRRACWRDMTYHCTHCSIFLA